MKVNCDTIVIGGGASGLLTAGFLAKEGEKVLLLEKMERLGRKVLISGKGRCNVTNDCTVEDFLPQVKSGQKFLMSALYSFTPEQTMSFFKERGVKLKTERGNRVFPVSDRSQDIVRALENFLKENGGQVRLNTQVDEILTSDKQITGVKLASGETLTCHNLIVATGGVSYPKTGSTGDGYRFAKTVNHTVVSPTAALVPIELKTDIGRRLQGLSLRNVTLTVRDKMKNKVLFQELGEMLFTHFGISGPLVLKASFYMDEKNIDNYQLEIDFKPALSLEQLDKRILRDFGELSNKDFQNSLGKLLPKKLIPVIIHKLAVEPTLKVNQFPAKDRKELGQLLKKFVLEPKGFRPIEEAIVTRGGVNTKEINPSTMESKQIKNLYFTGEVLDIDAYTGGYNLQLAFSTAFLAAQAIVTKENRA